MRSKLLILIITAIWGASCSSLLVGFTPSSYCEDKIIELIDDSEESIDIAVYSINNTNIVDALKKAHSKGIKIRILTDRLQAAGKSSKAKELFSFGLNIKIHSKLNITNSLFMTAKLFRQVHITGQIQHHPKTVKTAFLYLMIEKWFRNIKIDLIIYGKLIRNKSQISGFKKG